MEIGIVGLPNVGKSTLFNALLKKQQAYVANYPFATIEPNIGIVPVPDYRLERLALEIQRDEHLSKPPPIVPATVKFVDIAGLVKGASQGEGLGNRFLAHIREVDAMAYVLRDFSDEDVIRSGSENPKSDFEVLESELILADLQTVEKSKEPIAKKIAESLQKGIPAREMQFNEEEVKQVKQLSLLSMKPVIVVINADENNAPLRPPLNLRGGSGRVIPEVVISAKLESELAGLSGEDQKAYLADLGIAESGLEKLVKKAYEMLGLQSFLTAGEKEVRAWTVKKGTKAPQAAGVIHGDFETHFIKADVINWEEFVKLGGWQKAREAGKVRLEGRDYVMAEGDVAEFKIGV